ncbi:MAG: hypothetical protein BWY67_02463 [Bacteroidetes bacterium ADurb.Bin397]|nr:MAG: hypothetical protein BWY67_02463 [Bacteroidetes bacterium ADurb.Bin397]
MPAETTWDVPVPDNGGSQLIALPVAATTEMVVESFKHTDGGDAINVGELYCINSTVLENKIHPVSTVCRQ